MKHFLSALACCAPFVGALVGLLPSCSHSSSPRSSSNLVLFATITSPPTGAHFEEGEIVVLEGSASDPRDGELAGGDLVWTSDVDGVLGVGASVSTTALTPAMHRVVLTATNSNGQEAAAHVFIQITAANDAPKRPGEINPYAGQIERGPVKLDDELILVARSDASDQMLLGILDDPISAYNGPSSTPVSPRITSWRAGDVPLAAAAGRILGAAFHQAALVSRASSGEFQLEVLGLASPDADPRNDRIAAYSFEPPIPSGPIEVAVADLDAFEEEQGVKVLAANRSTLYHDEVALAYPELFGADLLARVEVLSFETGAFPEDPTTPAMAPTSVTTAWTTAPMHPDSRLVVRHGDNLFGGANNQYGPHLIVAYVDLTKRIALDVFELQRTRDDPDLGDPTTDIRNLVPVLHATLSDPLTDSAITAGGWDLIVGDSGNDAFNFFTDLVIVIHNASGQFVQQVWSMDLQGSGSGPASFFPEQGEFGRVTSGANSVGLTLLPDARLRIALGRISEAPNLPCEALGLFVLADTNRGAVVQSFTASIIDAAIGATHFGPVNAAPVWPSAAVLLAHPDTNRATQTSLAAGGFVSRRNGLIDERGYGVHAVDCQDVSSKPFLGPMPSFYVADAEAHLLHGVTLSPASTLASGIVTTVELDPSIDARPILLAADATGDAAYYGAFTCAGGNAADCRRVFLGDAELHYVIQNIESSSVLLQAPPKHVDYLPALGGMVDVSMRAGFFAQFTQMDVADGRVVQKLKTDWGIGARSDLALGPPSPKGGFSSILELSMDVEHRTVQEHFQSKQVKVLLTQTTGAVDDDVVWGKQQTIDFWRFPAQGGDADADGADGFPDDAYMEIAIPDKPLTLVGAGTLNDSYQPTHTVGNVLSYPTFSNVQNGLGELFDYLGSYVPSDANGTRPCVPLVDGSPGCIVENVSGALERVNEVLAGETFVGGEFVRVSQPIDVAQVLQVGGIAYSAELEFSNSIQAGSTVTNNNSIKADANVKIPLKVTIPVKGIPVRVPIPIGQLKLQLRADASFENARVSENSTGSTMKVSLHMPSDVPIERSYQIRPSFGYTSWGGLRVAYEVNTEGPTSTFWEQNYGAPDPALNMPHRIVRTANGHQLGTDFSRGRIKGFFVRDGKYVDPIDPGSSLGELLTDVPHAGDVLQLQARVSNLSVATHVLNLKVRFSAQEYRNGMAVGAESFIGEATIDFLPFRGQFPDHPEGHIQSAYVLWDTTGFEPPPSDSLITYLVRVTVDPDNHVANETHELFDRFGDPLTGPNGQVLDPGLEKGQNNRGWSMVRLAPPLTPSSPLALQAGSGERGAALSGHVRASRAARGELVSLALKDTPTGRSESTVRGRVDERIPLTVELRSDRLALEYGSLRVFDGDPNADGLMILSRTVQGIDERGAREDFVWLPMTRGPRVLHVVYTSASGDDQPLLRIPAFIE